MSPLARRAFALALAALLLAPFAAAQGRIPEPEEPAPPEPPADVDDCAAPTTVCLPDLLPMNPRANTSDERFPSKLCTDFVNLGEAPTATPFRVLLRVDGVDVADQQFSKQYQRGQGENNVCWDDIAVTAGRHSLVIVVDSNDQVPESDEDNNARSVLFYVKPTPLVDLRVKSLQVSPREGGTRANQIFQMLVTNTGSLASNATTLDLSDTNGPMATFFVAPLQPGQEQELVYATRPDLRAPGTFVARAVVDPLGNISEIDELNNDAFFEYTVLEHPAPDLVITNVEVSGSRTEFRGLLVNVTVENVGDRAVRGNLVRAYNETGEGVASAFTPSVLMPNVASTLQLRIVLRAGERMLDLRADPFGEIIERNETNNAWPLAITIEPAPVIVLQPNLIVERVFAMPNDPRPGEAVSVGALIRNVGTNRSAPGFVNFTIDGAPIGSAAIPALAPDLSHTAYVPWIGSSNGTHAITAIADGADTIAELDEGDNALRFEFLIGATLPPEEEPIPEPEPEPPVVTPPVTPPVNTTKPPTNTTDTPAGPTASRIALGQLILTTNPVPGGVKGIVSASLRNLNIQPIGLVTVSFKADGVLLKEVLVGGIPGASTRSATTGEIDLPAGAHTVTAEVRIVGSTGAPVTAEKAYDVAAGEKGGVPGFELSWLAAAVALGLLARRRRS